ncbi:hypothetical protein DRE_00372 [Drechslerella stenobrocha 248]|uniref:Uncharacterized protein n=1 Tax=Drechslerella stenobrocha 248 TaxID=1043628 RepID=W7HV56_9PEZI|nr:hypothetical protein DRE_00372 [Drechslerella stenobrocha 248]
MAPKPGRYPMQLVKVANTNNGNRQSQEDYHMEINQWAHNQAHPELPAHQQISIMVQVSITGFGSEKLLHYNIPSWKPFTLRLPFLLFLILLTISFIIAIELVLQKSQRDGALSFALQGRLSSWQVFVSQYIGTIASVIFGILLSLVDLDAKRLEPWFQLSTPGGASAKDSILLCYPFDFMAFVPFKAARRGHWSIFHIGTATVLVFWLITPLQSSLIATVQQQVVIPSAFRTTRGLRKLSVAEPETPSFMHTAYSISWLNATPPAYSTKLEASLPFEPSFNPGLEVRSQLWAANTTAYSLDLDCEEAEQSTDTTGYIGPNGQNVTNRIFRDKQSNCTFKLGHFPVGFYDRSPVWRPYYAQLIGYNSGASSNYYLNTSTCYFEADPQLFLLVFSYQKSINDTVDVNALYCRSKYQSSAVRVVVDAASKSVQNVTQLSPPEELKPEEFDADVFETIISGGGVSIFSYNGGPFGSAPHHAAKTREINALMANTDWDFESAVLGYMFAIESDLQLYLNPGFLASTIAKVYKLLFSTYVATQLLTPENSEVDGRILFTTEAVVVPEVYARILEGLLGATAVLLLCFLALNTRRCTGLLYDPASLAGTMALVANEPQLLKKFSHLDGASTSDEVQQAVAGESLKFKIDSRTDGHQLHILSDNINPATVAATPGIRPYKGEYEPSFELGPTAGSLFIFILAALFAFAVFIFQYSRANNGLPRLSDNIFVFQLVFSYIPTVIGTLLEPWWALLTRFISILQPLETLRRGNALASDSLTLKFESVPPPLTIFSAIKSGHYFLSILAATVLSTNILAVALGALFAPATVREVHPLAVTNGFSPALQALPYQFGNGVVNESLIPANYFAVGTYDYYYTLNANFTSDVPLPPWTTPDRFFFPVEVAGDQASNSSDLFQAETTGLQAGLTCGSIDVSASESTSPLLRAPVVKLAFRTRAFGDSGPTCELAADFRPSQLEENRIPGNLGVVYNGPLAAEAYPTLWATSNTTSDDRICQGLVPAIFSRTHSITSTLLFNISSVQSQAIICRPKLSADRFRITFDASRQIVAAEQMSPVVENNMFSGNIDEAQFWETIGKLFRAKPTYSDGSDPSSTLTFNANSLPTDWIDVLIQRLSNSTAAFDPRTPLQDVDLQAIGQELGKSYSRVFTIVLGLYHQLMFARDIAPSQLEGTRTTSIVRVQMSTVMFALIVGLLTWYFVVAVYFYLFRVARIFQHLPTTLASEIQLFHRSSVLDDVRGTEFLTSQQREAHLMRLNKRYGYGRFIGDDNIERLGIEREPLVGHLTNEEVRNNGLGRVGLKLESSAHALARLFSG